MSIEDVVKSAESTGATAAVSAEVSAEVSAAAAPSATLATNKLHGRKDLILGGGRRAKKLLRIPLLPGLYKPTTLREQKPRAGKLAL